MCQTKESNKCAPGRVVIYIYVHLVSIYTLVMSSGVATWGQSATPDSEKFAKNREKEGKTGKIGKKSGRKGKNREVLSLCPS